MGTEPVRFCSSCGHPAAPGGRFCTSCGSPLDGSNPTRSPDPTTVVEAAPVDLLRELLARATAGEYQIVRELGRGGMATVYLAREISLDRQVAIKAISPSLGAPGGTPERFILEARTAAAISHPNVIPIYAVRQTEHVHYFVMKFVPGQRLDELAAEGPVPIERARRILTQIGAALESAHRLGVVHRDVKPANILVDGDDWVTVTDFGIAKVTGGEALTMTGLTVGTPSYMSPEQCAGQAVSPASDQYSFGCLAYELLTGACPIAGEGIPATLVAHLTDAPAPLRDRRPDCPAETAAAVMRMLAKRPEGRWPSMAAAVAALAPAPDAPRSLATGASAAAGSRQITGAVALAGRRIAPPGGTLAVGQTAPLTVLEDRSSGGAAALGGVRWSADDPRVVAITAAGGMTALATGTATVKAVGLDWTLEATFTVTRVEVAEIRLGPVPTYLEVGECAAVVAVPLDRFGGKLEHRVASWTSSDPAVVAVTAEGELEACGPGLAIVEVTSGAAATSLSVRVVPATVARVRVTPSAASLRVGESVPFVAEALSPSGRAIEGPEPDWKSSDPAIIAIRPDGIATGLRAGSAKIAAVVGNRRALVPVQVDPAGIS